MNQDPTTSDSTSDSTPDRSVESSARPGGTDGRDGSGKSGGPHDPQLSGSGRPGRIPARLHRDPAPPRKSVLGTVNGRVLDPSTALTVQGVAPRPTVYVGPRLIVSAARDADDVLTMLRQAADLLGWEVRRDNNFSRFRVDGGRGTGDAATGFGLSRYVVSVQSSKATVAPDGWVLLQQARAQFGLKAMQGVGLDHVLFPTHDVDSFPHHDSNPLQESNPHHDSNPALGYPVSTYLRPGYGGRQPIAFVGPRPHRRAARELSGRRPVVAILDTGCGSHPWLDDVVRRGIQLDGIPIGYTDAETDPEQLGDHSGPLDGSIDELSGHGTFISGLVHQACPDADIAVWRVVNSSGPIVESDLIDALTRIAELVRRHAEGEKGGFAIDVLNLSMGYYHETPEDALFDPTMRNLLELFGRCGTAVVCSAGNDATARPLYPAAFGPWDDGTGMPTSPDRVPLVSVGALNPDRTVALFSNTGPWVRCYEPGAAVVSTMPALQGGLEPVARTWAYGLQRESIDPDDFTGGFALWSGTSFAAPLMAGKLAGAMLDTMPSAERTESKDAAVARVWQAVVAAAKITR